MFSSGFFLLIVINFVAHVTVHIVLQTIYSNHYKDSINAYPSRDSTKSSLPVQLPLSAFSSTPNTCDLSMSSPLVSEVTEGPSTWSISASGSDRCKIFKKRLRQSLRWKTYNYIHYLLDTKHIVYNTLLTTLILYTNTLYVFKTYSIIIRNVCSNII